MTEIYFADDRGINVLGPYTKAEIQPQMRARQQLGYPQRTVHYIEATSIEQAREKVQRVLRTARYYVKRTRWQPCEFGSRVATCYHVPRCGPMRTGQRPGEQPFGSLRTGWTGSITGLARAMREAAAWERADWQTEILLSTAQVRAQVRAWEKARKS